MKSIVIFSGGLDSATLLYHLRAEGHQVHAVTFLYGQRHHREVRSAETICRMTQVPQEIVDLTGLSSLFGKNALTDAAVEVPVEQYSVQSLPVTTVPNRNMILLSVAVARAISLEFDAVAFGAADVESIAHGIRFVIPNGVRDLSSDDLNNGREVLRFAQNDIPPIWKNALSHRDAATNPCARCSVPVPSDP